MNYLPSNLLYLHSSFDYKEDFHQMIVFCVLFCVSVRWLCILHQSAADENYTFMFISYLSVSRSPTFNRLLSSWKIGTYSYQKKVLFIFFIGHISIGNLQYFRTQTFYYLINPSCLGTYWEYISEISLLRTLHQYCQDFSLISSKYDPCTLLYILSRVHSRYLSF